MAQKPGGSILIASSGNHRIGGKVATGATSKTIFYPALTIRSAQTIYAGAIRNV